MKSWTRGYLSPFHLVCNFFLNLRGSCPIMLYKLGSISRAITSNPSHLFNLLAPYFDTSLNDKKTILPLKNFTPVHRFRIQPAHCFIKHKLKFFLSSLCSCISFSKNFFLSPLHSCISFNPLSQQPGTSPHKAKPLSLPSLLLPKLRRSFKLVEYQCSRMGDY